MMKFQLWDHPNDSHGESKCFAERTQDEVKSKFHNMGVGEDQLLHESPDGRQHVIVRVE